MMYVYESDPLDRELLRALLSHEGYANEIFSSREALLAKCGAQAPGMIILGMHDGQDGLSFVERVRQTAPSSLMVIENAPDDRLTTRLYELGADEVLARPVSPQLLAARLRNMQRRSTVPAMEEQGEDAIVLGGLRLYPSLLRLHKGDQVIHLTPLQTRLLHHLMLNAGQIVSKHRLEDRIWGYRGEAYGNPLKTHVFHLRHKVEEDPQHPELIRTIKGVGYMFHPPQQALG